MIVYIDMDDVLCDFSGAHKQALIDSPAIQYPQSQYGFFTGLQAIEGGVEAVQTLLESDQYNPYILTAPSIRNPLCYTEKRVWIEDKFGLDFVDRLIICAHKNLLKGDFLIDDHVSGCGQDGFEGRFLHFGSEQFPSWVEVMTELGFS